MTHTASTPPDLDGDGTIPRLDLTAQESAVLRDVAERLVDADPARPLDRQLDTIAVRAQELPVRVRTVLTRFRLTGQPYGGLLLSGLTLDPTLIGPTPTDQSNPPRSRELDCATALLLLIGSLLGSPFSSLTQQSGRLTGDMFPVPEHEHEKLGSSSTTMLHWHIEDAFHPHRADWLVLLGLRNHDDIATTFVPVTDLDLDPDIKRVLFEERFVILPDKSHSTTLRTPMTGNSDHHPSAETFERIIAATHRPRELAVLTGDPDAPFLCIDPPYMRRRLRDPEAERALDTLIDTIDRSLRDVVVAPGQALIVDNKRAVHGRRPFRARYDGTDRWLRRVKVTADLRPTEGRRFGPHGRALV
ncbi:clavaminate synthase [Embleya scabrispora]|uniref:Clavaminate synthase n=1 Tax=Embleya scabrispora TaxID=159449 RepID=A0A1T3P4V3_9ACTN|nr:guanitoxin biosynthesis L-enduracididine beta-hydroxylase GntD [Embleya scabrispora]OPC84093.1 clavaminate synthase [Embleya scabrispora]